MKEEFLHYLWKFQKFSTAGLRTVAGESVQVLATGLHNQNSGPDFFNAKISIGDQVWAGNVEIHLNASQWYAHFHEQDPAYDNVVLHVVWAHDADIFRKDGSVIPTLELQQFVSAETLSKYRNLFSKEQKWINCEGEFAGVDPFLLDNWLERLFIERLEMKSKEMKAQLLATTTHWEALLFRMLAKNFGLKVNAEAFLNMAQSMDFSVVKKCAQNQLHLEALFFGQAGLLEEQKEDSYFELLRKTYDYLRHKFDLNPETATAPRYFRLRPPNFPTLRLSQLSVLFAKKESLFSEIIAANSIEDFYSLFKVSAAPYWDTHYNFGLSAPARKKQLTKNFIDLLVINTVIPLKFCYAEHSGKDNSEQLFLLASEIASEDNAVVDKYNALRQVSTNAQQSQALLQLKTHYCEKHRCLNCAVGNALLKS